MNGSKPTQIDVPVIGYPVTPSVSSFAAMSVHIGHQPFSRGLT